MNSVNIIGTMTRDIELKYLPSGTAVGSFAIAVNQDYKNQQGQKVEKTSFFDIKVIGKQSETINQYFKKGSRIGISGSLDQEVWTAQDGTNRSKVTIKLESFSFIDRKQDNQGEVNNQQPRQQQNNQAQYVPEIDIDDMEETIPFQHLAFN